MDLRFAIFDLRMKVQAAIANCKSTIENLLSLRELEPRTGALLAVFLTFFLARVAGYQSCFLQSRTQVRVIFHQRTRDAVTDRTSLTGGAAAVNVDENVELCCRIRKAKRLADDHLQCFVGEVGVELTLVHHDVARTRAKVNACCRGLSAAGAVILNVSHKSLGPRSRVQCLKSLALPWTLDFRHWT